MLGKLLGIIGAIAGFFLIYLNGDKMKVLNITHESDMDGRGCEILTRLVFKNSNEYLTRIINYSSDVISLLKDHQQNYCYSHRFQICYF